VTAQLEIVDPGPPEVVKTNDIVHVSSGSTLTLLCRGNQSLHWSLEDFVSTHYIYVNKRCGSISLLIIIFLTHMCQQSPNSHK